jgi:hypothetical protein
MPVQEASAAVLGVYGPRPGAFMPCALVYETLPGPAVVGAALAIGIPEDRSRHACLFMEEAIADRVSWRPQAWPRRDHPVPSAAGHQHGGPEHPGPR